jgi:cytochrome P450
MVFRPNHLIPARRSHFPTLNAFRAIYHTKANVKKAKQYQAWARRVTGQTSFTATDKTVHARKIQVLNAAFSDKALRSADDVSLRHIHRWCDLLEEGSESTYEPQ